MSQPPSESGEFLTKLHEELRNSAIEGRVMQDFEEVSRAYASAMIHGQVLELAVRLAVPFVAASVDDDVGAKALLAKHRKVRWADALRDLELHWPEGLEMPKDLLAKLDKVRSRRNFLAHEFWWRALPAILVGKKTEVVQSLHEDEQGFASFIQELIETTAAYALRQRGLVQRDIEAFSSLIMATYFFRPEPLEGLDLFDDGEEIVKRLANLLGLPEDLV